MTKAAFEEKIPKKHKLHNLCMIVSFYHIVVFQFKDLVFEILHNIIFISSAKVP